MHSDPRTDMMEGSAARIVKVEPRLSPVIKLSGEGTSGERPVLNVLSGLRVRGKEGLLLGMAMPAPLKPREDHAWQWVFQPDIEWGRLMK